MIITPKSARKHQRRHSEQLAAAQLQKIRERLAGFAQAHETPAMAVKRLLEELATLKAEHTSVARGAA